MRPDQIREIHVVANTHWDREFRDSFEKTRAHLVEMMDTVLDILERDPPYASFTLDGHTILAEDYLEIRPERREQIARLLCERRLFVGPWFTLPDAMNIGAEAIVRNLLWGCRTARDLGGEPMRVGYIPANWGQPGQIPQILRGFGIESALIYRGISPHECPSEFLWRSPDGSEVLGHRFHRLARYNWYYRVHRPATRGKDWLDKDHTIAGSGECPVRVADGRARGAANFRLIAPEVKVLSERVADAVRDMLALEAGDASTPLFLAMHGHDVSVAHPLDPEVVRLADEALPDTRVFLSNLEDFMRRVGEELDRESAVVLTGERRMNLKEGFWTYLLPGTVSIRPALKVQNFEAETALAQIAEPLAAMAWTHGAEWPWASLDRAWRLLLSNHTHDAIAGCAPDVVSEDVAFRARQALDLADVVAEHAMAHLAQSAAPANLPSDAAALVAFNTLPFPRQEVIEVEVAMPSDLGESTVEIDTAEPLEEIARVRDSLFVDNPWDVPTITGVTNVRLRIATRLGAMSCHAITVAPGDSEIGAASQAARSHLSDELPPEVTRPSESALDNGLIRIEAQPDGTVTLTHHATGRVFQGAGRFLDEGALGTFWWPESPKRDRAIRSDGPAEIEIVESGLLQSTLQIRVRMEIPRECIGDARSEATVPLEIETRCTLRMGDLLVRVEVSLNNQARDHRLRVLFPTGIRTDHVDAGAHFDVIRRPIAHPDCDGWIEPFHGTAPMQGFVDLSDGEVGLALIPHGLLEYEVFDDAERTLALTLFRSIPIRLAVSEEKQEVLPDPGPLCLGPQRFQFALYPHAGDCHASACWRESQRFNTPVRVVQAGRGRGERGPASGLIRIDNPRIAVTAVKRAEESDRLVVRLFNASDRDETAEITLGFPAATVHLARLDETGIREIPVKGSAFSLTIVPHRIETLLITA
ncbi:hypothetical protein JXA47_12855 [Candidatus Sumerlaeota bacterium]|nr:hypothetical protein [Candidatus Sumerlaeota bacterium]